MCNKKIEEKFECSTADSLPLSFFRERGGGEAEVEKQGAKTQE